MLDAENTVALRLVQTQTLQHATEAGRPALADSVTVPMGIHTATVLTASAVALYMHTTVLMVRAALCAGLRAVHRMAWHRVRHGMTRHGVRLGCRALRGGGACRSRGILRLTVSERHTKGQCRGEAIVGQAAATEGCADLICRFLHPWV